MVYFIFTGSARDLREGRPSCVDAMRAEIHANQIRRRLESRLPDKEEDNQSGPNKRLKVENVTPPPAPLTDASATPGQGSAVSTPVASGGESSANIIASAAANLSAASNNSAADQMEIESDSGTGLSLSNSPRDEPVATETVTVEEPVTETVSSTTTQISRQSK